MNGQPRDLADLLDLDLPCPVPEDLRHAINHNQAACKTWLVDELHRVGSRYRTVYLLGGWYGVLGAMLLGDERFRIERVVSLDIDPRCAAIARWLNRRHCSSGRFEAIEADVCAIDYAELAAVADPTDRASAAGGEDAAPDLLINTSCEHIEVTSEWLDRVPDGMLMACQSNDYYCIPEHVNCLPDLQAFKADVPMRQVHYEGVLARKKYTRFMLIGRK